MTGTARNSLVVAWSATISLLPPLIAGFDPAATQWLGLAAHQPSSSTAVVSGLLIAAAALGVEVVAMLVRSLSLGIWHAQLAQAALGGVIGGLLWITSWAPNNPLPAMALAAGALVAILTDTLFITIGRTMLALAPLGLGYLASTMLTASALPWTALGCLAVSWTTLLTARTIDRTARWPRAVEKESATKVTGLGVILLACATTVSATGLAVTLGSALPDNQRGFLAGPLSTTITLRDPRVDLEHYLRLPDEETVLTYHTSSGQGVHLRTSVLNTLTDDGWTQTDMILKGGTPRRPATAATAPDLITEVSITGFASPYLPAPYAPHDWRVAGRWLYDPASLSIVSASSGDSDPTLGLAYQVTSTPIMPTTEQLASAQAGDPGDGGLTRFLPPQVPATIVDLTASVTSGATSDGQKAQAIESWLADSSRFSYSLDAAPAAGLAAMESFLTNEHSGYCVHFATSMALMARLAQIPARVAIGFTPGYQQLDQGFQVTNHHMHAWPELYFDDLGWIRFEPTPSTGGDGNVDLTSTTNTEANDPAPSTRSSPEPHQPPTVQPSAQESATLPPGQGESDQEDQEGTGETPENGKARPVRIGPLSGIGVAGMALLTLTALPAATRRIRRARRLGHSTGPDLVDGVWHELRATAIDCGHPWPSATPRQIAAGRWPMLDEDGRRALARIALAREQSLYARTITAGADLRADADLVCAEWLAALDRSSRMRARWWPASVVSGE